MNIEEALVKVPALIAGRSKRSEGSVSRLRNRCASVVPGVRLTIFLFLLTLYGSLQAVSAHGWTRQQSGTMAWLHAVYFLDQSHGWAAGSGGTLLFTRDAGQTWRKLHRLGNDTLRDVYFANENVGWALAERDPVKLTSNDEARSYLLKTEDGGFSWRRVFFNSPAMNPRLARFVFVDAWHGWVFGETGIVFATDDGGEHWRRLASPTKHLLLGGAFSDGSRGCLVGAAGTIIQTSDGGQTWTTGIVRDRTDARFTATNFVDARMGWAVGTAGSLYFTSNGGRSWIAQNSTVDVDLSDVKFIDRSTGWAVGNGGTILHTTDGGVRWFLQTTPVDHPLDRVVFIDRNHGWAVGFGGTILAYSDAIAPQLKP